LELSQQIENILGALRFGDVFSGVQFRIVFSRRAAGGNFASHSAN
jgi:hypothetical protein